MSADIEKLFEVFNVTGVGDVCFEKKLNSSSRPQVRKNKMWTNLGSFWDYWEGKKERPCMVALIVCKCDAHHLKTTVFVIYLFYMLYDNMMSYLLLCSIHLAPLWEIESGWGRKLFYVLHNPSVTVAPTVVCFSVWKLLTFQKRQTTYIYSKGFKTLVITFGVDGRFYTSFLDECKNEVQILD